MDDVEKQPTPEEFRFKNVVFGRLRDVAMALAEARRMIGLQKAAGSLSSVSGFGSVLITVYQSGLIIVVVEDPSPALHLTQTEFVWDEAMFTDRMT